MLSSSVSRFINMGMDHVSEAFLGKRGSPRIRALHSRDVSDPATGRYVKSSRERFGENRSSLQLLFITNTVIPQRPRENANADNARTVRPLIVSLKHADRLSRPRWDICSTGPLATSNPLAAD